MTAQPIEPNVLVIGLDPYRMPPGFDPKPIAEAIEAGMKKLAEHGIVAQSCLFGPGDSGDPEPLITAALQSEEWRCVIVGVGVRKDENNLELFERIINLVRQHAPEAAIAFNATVPDFYEAAARWIDVPDS